MVNTLLDDLNNAASKVNDGYTFVINPLNTFSNPVSIPAPTINLIPLPLAFSSGDVNLTLVQSLLLYIVCSGSLTSSWSITFPVTGVWSVDTSLTTFSGHHMNIVSGATAVQITSSNIYLVSIPAIGTVTIK